MEKRKKENEKGRGGSVQYKLLIILDFDIINLFSSPTGARFGECYSSKKRQLVLICVRGD